MSVTARINGIIPVPLTIFRNDTVIIPVIVVADDGVTPYNLTSATVTFAAKWAITDTTNAISLSSLDSNEIAITDAPAGEMSLTFAEASTSSLPVGFLELPYQLSITDYANVPLSVLFGTIRVLPNLTT